MAGAIFLKLEGFDGEAKDEAHKDEIEISSWNWGMVQESSGAVGMGSAVGKVSVQDLNVTKSMDKTSPKLALACCVGTRIPSGELFVQRAGEDKVQAIRIEMKNILVSSYSVSDGADTGILPQESLTLSIKWFKYVYTPQDEKGEAMAEVENSFDIEANEKV